MASLPVTLLGLATAVPPNLLEQSAVADRARRIYAESFVRYPKLADVFVNAGIERRYSVCPMEWFEIAVVPLALGLRLFALMFSAANGALLIYRIRVENRALAWAADELRRT